MDYSSTHNAQTNWNVDCADDATLHVWREPYVWATSTGATVDADAGGSNYLCSAKKVDTKCCIPYLFRQDRQDLPLILYPFDPVNPGK